jgi:hypothetical protein
MLNDMRAIMCIMHTRLSQLQDLMKRCEVTTNDMLNNRISSIRVEVTVHTEMMINGHRLCNGLDLFQIEGLESVLGEPFGTISCALNKFLYYCRFHISAFAAKVYGRNDYAPSIRIWSAYTFARQAIGGSGKFMGRQL